MNERNQWIADQAARLQVAAVAGPLGKFPPNDETFLRLCHESASALADVVYPKPEMHYRGKPWSQLTPEELEKAEAALDRQLGVVR